MLIYRANMCIVFLFFSKFRCTKTLLIWFIWLTPLHINHDFLSQSTQFKMDDMGCCWRFRRRVNGDIEVITGRRHLTVSSSHYLLHPWRWLFFTNSPTCIIISKIRRGNREVLVGYFRGAKRDLELERKDIEHFSVSKVFMCLRNGEGGEGGGRYVPISWKKKLFQFGNPKLY